MKDKKVVRLEKGKGMIVGRLLSQKSVLHSSLCRGLNMLSSGRPICVHIKAACFRRSRVTML